MTHLPQGAACPAANEMGIQDMKMRRIMVAMMVAALCALSLAAMVGCEPLGQTEDTAAQNRAYLSQANTSMIHLNADLDSFTAAVAAEDLVTMEQVAGAVYRDIDAFEAITAPNDMKGIHEEYKAGCEDLKQALQSYVALYKDADEMDEKDMNEAIAAIQAQYDSGIAHLEAGDKMVTELPGALPESSSSSSDTSESSSSEALESSSSSSNG